MCGIMATQTNLYLKTKIDLCVFVNRIYMFFGLVLLSLFLLVFLTGANNNNK